MKCPICKKNISDNALKCPYCKTRTGLLCKHCNTVNPISNRVCKNCGQELLKICPHCKSVNYPIATKCRKCSTPFPSKNKIETEPLTTELETKQVETLSQKQAYTKLKEGLLDKDKKIFSITGAKGIGKSTLLKKVIKDLKDEQFQWCIGKCTQLTQLTAGGVIQDMLLNLFKLPNYYANNEDLKNDAIRFFANEFRFLNTREINEFYNFLYNSKDGNYEDIIINKKSIYDLLNKVFDAFYRTGRFIFVIDNFDFIDGFSVEFISKFIRDKNHWKNLKFIVIYNEPTPISGLFPVEKQYLTAYTDINLATISREDYVLDKFAAKDSGYVTDRELEIIFQKCEGNPAYIEQAIAYCYDCQIADKAFIMETSFSKLIKERLEILRKINQEAYKMLCSAAILGDRINLVLLREIFGYKLKEFNDIVQYLAKTKFVRQYSENLFEFNNLYLWETILKSIKNDKLFEDINIKIGKAISIFTLNTNATMAMISHNLKENRMAFDIWTKNTRLAASVGDINLYVISQKQCLALLNEFNENETLNIRYNISEKLGKLLTEYDPEEAMEYLPDAISNARTQNNEEKEIELLGYLALCCRKCGNYFGDIECVDNILKKLEAGQDLEIAMIKAIKIPSLLNIGNCGEVVNLIDNDIMPILNNHLAKPRLDKTIPLGFLYDTWLKVYLHLAKALAIQGNDRAFTILTNLFEIIDKHKINDEELMCRAKLVMAYANMMKGNFQTTAEILSDISNKLGSEDPDKINTEYSEIANGYNLITNITKFFLKDYDNIQQNLAQDALFADDTSDEFSKNIFKTLLGKLFCDMKQARKALSIYNEEVTYFAEKKNAIGALITWYLIAQSNLIMESPKQALETASQALEIAKNPKIDNIFLATMLKILIAQIYMDLSDYESANIHLESAMKFAQKYSMGELLSRIYLLYGRYYQNMGTVFSPRQKEYLSGASKMYDKSMKIVAATTKNNYIKEQIITSQQDLNNFCNHNGIAL